RPGAASGRAAHHPASNHPHHGDCDMGLLDFIGNYFDGWRREEFGGVPLLVKRDDVERFTSYKHPRAAKDAGQRGIFPHIDWWDGQAPRLACSFRTGSLEGYDGFRQLVLNADGQVMRWE